MKVYRLVKEKYSQRLDGKGAALYGGRWNSKGTELIYTSANRALAMVEVLVHLPVHLIPADFKMIEIEIDDVLEISAVNLNKLPSDWSTFPPLPGSQKFGDAFVLENQFCVLKTPSALVMGDFNYLLNPHHPEFTRCKIAGIEAFGFDQRLIGRAG